MNERFFELKKEKQDRMINGALKVFSQYGYHHASTDEIVREANISKGLLFHYFESKMGLYVFLYDYSTRFVALELTNVDKDENGFFDLYKQILTAKADAMSGEVSALSMLRCSTWPPQVRSSKIKWKRQPTLSSSLMKEGQYRPTIVPWMFSQSYSIWSAASPVSSWYGFSCL